MSINYWRYKFYTGDGCAKYQCLQCYGEWESPHDPGYFNEDMEYRASWHFCPICGTRWISKLPPKPEEWFRVDSTLGPRRQKIVDAFKNQQDLSQHGAFWWVIERHPGSDNSRWTPVCKVRGLKVPAKRVLQIKRYYGDSEHRIIRVSGNQVEERMSPYYTVNETC